VPGIERSVDSLRFADIADAQCTHCGEPRACADQKRPIYPNVSGIPQDRLLTSGRESERLHELQLSDARREAEMAQMRALMERQNATIERLTAMQETRAIGRPKRAPTE
jgi:phage major head subunit gpT-like protein